MRWTPGGRSPNLEDRRGMGPGMGGMGGGFGYYCSGDCIGGASGVSLLEITVPGTTVDVYCWDCSTYTISPEENPFFNPLAGNGPGDFINKNILNGLHLLPVGGPGAGTGCPTVPPHPGYANLDANIAEASKGLRGARTIMNLRWFLQPSEK